MALEIPPMKNNTEAGSVGVSENVFGQTYNEGLVHQLVTTFMARARAGTKAQKSRANVRGGGRKPWRQKGTGNARSGTSRSPLWRSGGVTFAAQPRVFEKKLNKKMYRAGMRSILSELLRQDRMFVGVSLIPSTPKTKELATVLTDGDALDALLVTEDEDRNLTLASRNLANITLRTTRNLDPVSLISADKVILTHEAVTRLEEWLG